MQIVAFMFGNCNDLVFSTSVFLYFFALIFRWSAVLSLLVSLLRNSWSFLVIAVNLEYVMVIYWSLFRSVKICKEL